MTEQANAQWLVEAARGRDLPDLGDLVNYAGTLSDHLGAAAATIETQAAAMAVRQAEIERLRALLEHGGETEPLPGPEPEIGEAVRAWEQKAIERYKMEYKAHYSDWDIRNAKWLYFWGYVVNGWTQLYEATGDLAHLDAAIDIVDRARRSARSVGSGWLGWYYWDDRIPQSRQQEYSLHESVFGRFAFRLLRVMREAGIAERAGYAEFYGPALAFYEFNIWDKWYARGDGLRSSTYETRGNSIIRRINPHMSAHFPMMALQLDATGTASQRLAQARKFRELYDQDMRAQIAETGGRWLWGKSWGQPPERAMTDVAHANHVVQYIVEAYEAGVPTWQGAIGPLTRTLRGIVEGNDHAELIDGRTTRSRYPRLLAGWARLAAHSAEAYELLADWTGEAYLHQVYGTMARAARWRGV